MDNQRPVRRRFVQCVQNAGFEVSLEVGCIRVIDESGEDYVYHPRYFAIAEPAQPAEANATRRDP